MHADGSLKPVRSNGGQGQSTAEPQTHIVWCQTTVMILIEGIKDRITSQPFIAGDAAITVEVVQHENLLNGMAER
jgi:hypothetical protein